MKTRSLVGRVVGIVLAAQILCASVLCVSALFHERHTRLRAFDESLQGRVDAVLSTLDEQEEVSAGGAQSGPDDFKMPAGDEYAVYGADGKLVASSPHAAGLLPQSGKDGLHDERRNGTTSRVCQRSTTWKSSEPNASEATQQLTVVYASPKTHLEHDIGGAARFYALLIGIVVVLTGISVLILLRIALRPLGDLVEAAGQISASSLVFAAPPSVLSVTELRPLAAALDAVMNRMGEAFATEKRFLGDAAHELKTAIAVVRSTVQVLMLRPRTVDEHAVGLRRILEDVTRVESLVAQMLHSSAHDDIPWGSLPALDLRESMRRVVQELASFAEAHEITIQMQDGPAALVRLHPDRAAALISNLLVNAIQHSSPGMTVQLGVEKQAPDRVLLRVVDTGSGISSQALPHVFERFFREDTSRSRQTGGTGLGLAICKSIAEGAGAKIAIQSTPQKGTEVHVIFMLA